MDTDLSVDSPTEASSCGMMETDENDIASSLRQLTDGIDLDDNLPQIQSLLRNAELHCLLALIPEIEDQPILPTPAHIQALLFLDGDIKAPIITARLGKLLSEDPADCPTFYCRCTRTQQCRSGTSTCRRPSDCIAALQRKPIVWSLSVPGQHRS